MMKIRGITLDADAKERFTFDRMVEEVVRTKMKTTCEKEDAMMKSGDDMSDADRGEQQQQQLPLTTTRLNLKRKDTGVQTVVERKKYSARNCKGQLCEANEQVYPYGYDWSSN